ncbi:MAG TPA: sigma-70 family RNA polymerase sigma factor [Myxococcales bacterium]|nr:sigma-70 family RNA polymerase sigma factor [Myxococcales bacterium]
MSAPTVEEVYRSHGADVARWAARLGGPRLELEDVVQEVFTQVHRHLGGFRGEAKLSTWLFRITENVVRRQRRRERWRAFWRGAPADAPAPEATPESELQRRQARALIRRALDRLSERQRTALVLFELEELPGEEVAERLGVTAANLWVILHRARAELGKRVHELRLEEDGSGRRAEADAAGLSIKSKVEP